MRTIEEPINNFKPCPFCGSKNVSMSFSIAPNILNTKYYHGECHDCAACGPSWESRGKAHNWWNERKILDTGEVPGE